MDAGIVGQFWVKGCDEHVVLSGCDGFAIDGCKDFNAGACFLDIRSADEGHGNLADAAKFFFAVETP